MAASVNAEGPVSALVIDSAKFRCSNCNGSKMYISKTLDDPNDVAGDTVFAALLLTYTGNSCQGLVCLCAQCGHEQVPFWYLTDVGTTGVGQETTMTDLIQSTTANLMAGLYGIPCVGTNVGSYYIVASNTAADPTVITWTAPKPNADSDGIWIITNILPVGLTLGA